MTLKMNMRPVRLAETGRHLFDAPYCFRDKIEIGNAVITLGNGCYYTTRDLSEAERELFVAEVKRLNDEQVREWGIG